jgi:hypothetical protein
MTRKTRRFLRITNIPQPYYPPAIPPEFHRHLSRGRNNLRTIRRWIKQDGLCWWCGDPTILYGDRGYYKPNGRAGRLSAKAATLDHLFSRLHPLRDKPTIGQKYVMACNSCNSKRSKEECNAHAKDEMIFIL